MSCLKYETVKGMAFWLYSLRMNRDISMQAWLYNRLRYSLIHQSFLWQHSLPGGQLLACLSTQNWFHRALSNSRFLLLSGLWPCRRTWPNSMVLSDVNWVFLLIKRIGLWIINQCTQSIWNWSYLMRCTAERARFWGLVKTDVISSFSLANKISFNNWAKILN